MRLGKGGLIDRSKPLSFSYDGHAYQGYQGDTLASALLANGLKTVARSFKYHRPRGIMTAGSEEPNALVTIGQGAAQEPNLRATTLELYAGLSARSQNCWPSVNFDILALNDLAAPFFGAGFYY
ncbi:MAG: (2Fe-2S)-binding protein, partial [Gammaproteobacteria bacterium]|nr:(2Fe-2S)-binding protein [Gammaproteobacteria bacterium]